MPRPHAHGPDTRFLLRAEALLDFGFVHPDRSQPDLETPRKQSLTIHGEMDTADTAVWVSIHLANIGFQCWVLWGGGACRLSRASWLHPTWGEERARFVAWCALLAGTFSLILGLIDPFARALWV